MEDILYAKFLNYYNASPQWFKLLLGYIYRAIPLFVRYGNTYLKYAKFLEKSQWWSKERLEEYQWRKLEDILKHAYENVPYYRKIFDERGIKPNDIKNFDDFKKLPFLTKEIVRDNFKYLIAKNYPKSKLLYVTTGGSTGTPLGLYYEKGVSRAKELAFITVLWNRVGYKIGDKLAVLRGNVVRSAKKNIFWEYEPIKNRLILSSYHMTDKNLPLYIEQIRKFKPKFLHVYPSVLTILAKFMKRNKIKPFSSIKAILASSENIYPWQIKLFKEVFQCKVFFFYGLTEMVALAGICEKSYDYHIFPEYSYVELIGKDGNRVTEEGAIGEIVGTTFDNYAMPLIRYRTGDLAVYTKQTCKCGRNYPLLKNMEGRLQELVVTKNNSLVTLTALIFAQHFKAFEKIKNMQLYQQEKGKIIVKIVKDREYTIKDEHEIKTKILKAVNGQLDIFFEYPNEIPKTKSGKHKFLIQKLPIDFDVIKF